MRLQVLRVAMRLQKMWHACDMPVLLLLLQHLYSVFVVHVLPCLGHGFYVGLLHWLALLLTRFGHALAMCNAIICVCFDFALGRAFVVP